MTGKSCDPQGDPWALSTLGVANPCFHICIPVVYEGGLIPQENQQATLELDEHLDTDSTSPDDGHI